MAVVQISRIQVRRGKANSGTGIPQLASGELAWAIDNQQLYIGNGSVAEGSPAVGNTKILTENDLTAQGNILNLIQHIYKSNDPSMQTGPNSNEPVTRYLQDRLDDRVTTTDFGTIGNGIADDTAALQRAIDQLFLNPATVGTTESRVVLELPAGTFKVTETIYIPSYTTLIGAGIGSSVISFTGTGPVFQFINDTSTIGNPSNISSTLPETNEPRNIVIKEMTIITNTDDQVGMQLDAVVDSVFENISIEGNWGEIPNEGSKGIAFDVFGLSICNRNKFRNITIRGFTYAVYAKKDIARNEFRACYITDVQRGFDFGRDINGSSVGEVTGPIENLLESCYFENVKQQAVYIENGQGNSINNCRMQDVGNDGGDYLATQYPQVYFGVEGNYVAGLQSDRINRLSDGPATVPYIPEATGKVEYNSYGTRSLSLTQITGSGLAFRLPLATDYLGIVVDQIVYNIKYVYRSTSANYTRQGTLIVTVDSETKAVQLTDEYNHTGDSLGETALTFTAKLLDLVGNNVTVSTDPVTLGIKYSNSYDSGVLTYSYSSIS